MTVVLERHGEGTFHGLARPHSDGQTPSRSTQYLYAISIRILYYGVAVADRYPPHDQLGRRQGEQQGEGVVDTGVGIDNQGNGEWGMGEGGGRGGGGLGHAYKPRAREPPSQAHRSAAGISPL